MLNRRQLALSLAAASLAACGRKKEADPNAPPPGTLAWAIAGDWRLQPDRDEFRHPLQTLLFWGLEPTMTVLEVLPGLGWYTSILAPYLAANHGHLIAAGFDPNSGSMAERETLANWQTRFTRDPALYGEITQSVVSRTEDRVLAPAGTVNLAILANTFHVLMARGIAERVLAEIYAALKPGGTFGVEQHRAYSSGEQDPTAHSGYVQEVYVKTLAQEAGFTFIAASDMNANPHDNRDHPFGVWSLPPDLRTSPLGRPDNPRYDTRPFQAIGESDRMTLRFEKPGGLGLPARQGSDLRP
ncbi:MAG: methyltransferase [Terricaulis sp.]